MMGEVVGDALANTVTLIDGIIVIGGGLAGAAELFMPHILAELNGQFEQVSGGNVGRLESRAFDLDNPEEFRAFLRGNERVISIPGTSRTIAYDPQQRIGIGTTRLGTSTAVSVGAYAFALHDLDRRI
jgi:glucokinase